MSNVYSTLLSAGHAGSVKDLEPVTGFRRILRCLTAFNAAAVGGETIHLFSVTYGWTYYQQTIDPVTSLIVDFRIVLPDDDTARFDNDGDIDYQLSGYLLVEP